MDQSSGCPFDAMRQKKQTSSDAMSDDSTQHQQPLVIEAHYIDLNACFTVLKEADNYGGYLPLQIDRSDSAPGDQQQKQEVSYVVQVKVITPVPMRPRYHIYFLEGGPLGDPQKIQHTSAKAMLAYLYERRPSFRPRPKSVNQPAWETPLVDVIPEYDIPEIINDNGEKNDIPLFNGNLTFILDNTIQDVLVSNIWIDLYGNSYHAKELPRECFLYCKSCKTLDLHHEHGPCPSV